MDRLILLYVALWVKFIRKPNFGEWLTFEDEAKIIIQAMRDDITKFPDAVEKFVSHIIHIHPKILAMTSWQVELLVFYTVRAWMSPQKIPLLVSGNGKDDKPVPWNYDGRSRQYWIHLLAREYGWTVREIEHLPVDVALAQAQEILTTEQLDREFTWQLSEIAYPYNKSTKQSEFKPMKRPYWMWMPAPEIKMTKLPAKLIPVGAVEDIGGMKGFFDAKNIEKDD